MKRDHTSDGTVSVLVKGKNLTITPALHDQVVLKMQRLDRYLDRLSHIEVELCTERTREADHHNHVDATATVSGRLVRVAVTNSDMYAAIDETVDKLYRQLNRHKERMKSHHGARHETAEAAPDLTGVGTGVADVSSRHVDDAVRIERLDMKPQFEDEAIDELQATDRAFYVFLNARTEQVNVIYRRSDGGYALIVPRIG